MDGSAQPVPFLRRVRVQGFRSIRDAEVTFGPLTVLLGLNGAGKSNVLDAVRFVGDALASSPGQAVTDRQGPAVVLHRGPSPAGPGRVHLEVHVEVRPPTGSSSTGAQRLTARYAIGLRLDDAAEAEAGTVIEHEECTVTSAEPGMSASYLAHHGRVLRGPDQLMGPVADTGTLVLPAAARWLPFAPVHAALRGMAFHALSPAAMRPAHPRAAQLTLDPAGGRLAEILDQLAARNPAAKQRVDDYLGAILPGALGIDTFTIDQYQTVRLRMADPTAEQGVAVFPAVAMSDGTLAAAGLLTALFQPGTWTGVVPLVAVEDPELGLHDRAGSRPHSHRAGDPRRVRCRRRLSCRAGSDPALSCPGHPARPAHRRRARQPRVRVLVSRRRDKQPTQLARSAFLDTAISARSRGGTDTGGGFVLVLGPTALVAVLDLARAARPHRMACG
ncbi:AAA family ATPase [Frankia sp. R82]|uniref:AAA family ATPase n=1 Tax=Frankia sp. R82 TaxID=2950553 RepID=UPI0020431E3B|nr:AAA family ATPase [Frankia sp. R82]MCM3886264.1 AAA family ATPase [Frankia sp. R82]